MKKNIIKSVEFILVLSLQYTKIFCPHYSLCSSCTQQEIKKFRPPGFKFFSICFNITHDIWRKIITDILITWQRVAHNHAAFSVSGSFPVISVFSLHCLLRVLFQCTNTISNYYSNRYYLNIPILLFRMFFVVYI